MLCPGAGLGKLQMFIGNGNHLARSSQHRTLLIGGLPHLFTIPAEWKGNWTLQLTERQGAGNGCAPWTVSRCSGALC